MRAHLWFGLLALTLVVACGSVDAPEDRGEPIAMVTARLDQAPAGLGETGPLRAALVWTNGLGFESAFNPSTCSAEYVEDPVEGFLRCEERLRNNVQVTTSDVEVEMEFPLTVTLAMYELPTPIVQHIEDPYAFVEADSDETLAGDFYSLPEAEVVLYEDGNGNGKLDLLPLGEPGPGPDRVVALSSGLDDDGRAVRTVVVYKAGPLASWIHAYYWMEYDAMPNDPNSVVLDPPPRENGIYTYRYSFGPEYELGQRSMLGLHALTAPDTWLGTEPEDAVITPVEQGMIQLFPASAQWPSWLSRGCERMVTFNSVVAVSPPPAGADVQCGADALAYSSHPDDYCGQTEIAVLPEPGGPAPDWWPCDVNGLKPGTPYRASTQRLDGDPTWMGNLGGLGFGSFFDPLWYCREGVIHHLDVSPFFSLPTTPPQPGSQVMCHSADSFSHVPPRADGCLFKYRTDLVSDPSSPHSVGGMQWDLRSSRPAWWPCDESGQLRADSGMVAPATPAEADCADIAEYRDPGNAPPIGSAIHCEDAQTLTFVPPWNDACDPKGRMATAYVDETAQTSFSGGTPDWWPCDEDGNFVPSPHYTAAP